MTALANVDVPFLSDRATRVGFALFNGELNGLMSDAKAYFAGSIPDYYNGCMQFSSLLQYFSDQNVNNWVKTYIEKWLSIIARGLCLGFNTII